MTRSAEDAAILLGGIAGYDPRDPTSADAPVPDYVAELATPVRELRVGVPRPYFWDELPSPIAGAVEGALGELRHLGLRVKDVEIPDWEAATKAAIVVIRCQAAAEYRTVLAQRGADLIPEVRERLEAGLATSAPDYIDAWRTAWRLRRALDDLFAEVDALALPGRDQLAPRMEPSGKLIDPLSPRNFTSPFNLARVPALTVPCGFSADGLPVGLQLAGRAWEESTLFRVAHAYQGVTDWHLRRPSLPDQARV